PGRGTAFQAPLWMDRMHRQLAPALEAQQKTITVRDRNDGSLLAVFPMITQRSSGVTIMQPADFGLCDYNCAVAENTVLERMAADQGVRQALRKTLKGADLMMFRKVRSDSFDVGRLFDRSRHSAGENPAYACEVGSDFDHWRLKVLKRKFTKELGR